MAKVKVNKKLSGNQKSELIKSSKQKKGVIKLKQKNVSKIAKKNIESTAKKVVKKNLLKKTENDSNSEAEELDKTLETVSSPIIPKVSTIKDKQNMVLKTEDDSISEINPADDETDGSESDDNEEDIHERVNNVIKKTIDPEQNERTVFVGNIASNTKVNQLKKLFAKCTVVSCRFRLGNGKPILKHKMRKESDSINAWVVFEHKKDVEIAIQLNGSEFKGRHIRVTKSQEKTSTHNNNQNDKCTIFVGNLKYSANDEKLYSIFSSCGEIDFVRTIKNDKGCSGVAYVCFKKPDSVGLALELNKTLLDDRPINVEKYSKNKSGASKKRKPEKEMSGVERRIMSKLMKDKNQQKDISSKLPFNKFGNKRNDGKNFDSNNKFNNNKGNKSENIKKKSEFRGIKVDSKKKFKRKNNKNPLHTLAKKIAPKE